MNTSLQHLLPMHTLKEGSSLLNPSSFRKWRGSRRYLASLSCGRLRARFIVLLALTWVAAIPAAAQVSLPPVPLVSWTSTGGAPIIDPVTGSIEVPAGAELYQAFSHSAVFVRLISRPYFGLEPAGWPSLEVGPASLTLMRDSEGGAMVFLGEERLLLPYAILLDDEGRSRQPLDFQLGYDSQANVATLAFAGSSYSLPAFTPAGTLGVVVSAGQDQPWVLDLIEITENPAYEADEADKKGKVDRDPKDESTVRNRPAIDPAVLEVRRLQGLRDSRSLLRAKNLEGAKDALLNAGQFQRDTVEWHVEAAGKLTHLALTLRREYDHRGAIEVALQAMELLGDAADLKPPPTASQRARLHEMAGYLLDELLRDPAAARAEYEQAIQLDTDSPRARQQSRRLEAAEIRALRQGRNQ